MTRATIRLLLAVSSVVAAVGAAAGTAAADYPVWRLEQPPAPAPPPGVSPVTYEVPLGMPGDLKMWAPNRGLLAVAGNAVVPKGLYAYDGASWHLLATVCGGDGSTARIAWAGPREFWTIADVRDGQTGMPGTTLCHFRDGEVVASYGTLASDPNAYQQMDAAACDGPNDCWFGGDALPAPDLGAFHLHWDGRTLTRVVGPQGRPVTDVQFHQGQLIETVAVSNDKAPARLTTPEQVPALLHRIDPGAQTAAGFQLDPFVPAPIPGQPDDATDLLALDGDGTQLWAVGGAARHGPHGSGNDPRGPIAARLGPDGAMTELSLDPGHVAAGERFVDVAAVPGTTSAWVATSANYMNGPAHVLELGADGTVLDDETLPRPDDPDPNARTPKGSAARISCVPSDTADCWLVTQTGWLFHLSDGRPVPVDDDPAFHDVIATRPADGSTPQFVPDTAPPDDSLLYAPPPVTVTVPVAPSEPAPPPRKVVALIKNVKTRWLDKRTVAVAFTLTHRAQVALVATRRKRTVATSGLRALRAGRHQLRIRLNPKRWPTKIRLDVGAAKPAPAKGRSKPTKQTKRP